MCVVFSRPRTERLNPFYVREKRVSLIPEGSQGRITTAGAPRRVSIVRPAKWVERRARVGDLPTGRRTQKDVFTAFTAAAVNLEPNVRSWGIRWTYTCQLRNFTLLNTNAYIKQGFIATFSKEGITTQSSSIPEFIRRPYTSPPPHDNEDLTRSAMNPWRTQTLFPPASTTVA